MIEIVDVVFRGEAADPELWDTNVRGYCSQVFVRFNNQNCYQLDFYEPVRLRQEIDGEVAGRKEIRADPQLVVIPEITLRWMIHAVQRLFATGYFFERVPVNWTDIDATRDLVVKKDEFHTQ